MSEFQAYHFRAIDRPLTHQEQEQVNQLSSRFFTNANSYSLHYSYSSFRHDEEKVLEKYYDAFLYEANWGTRKLMFRFPKDLVDAEALEQFTIEDTVYSSIQFEQKKNWAILKFEYGEEEGWVDWIEEGSYWLDKMIQLREDIINGDYRSLYLYWLMVNENYEEYNDDDDDDELHTSPPVPPNLKKLSTALESFTEFFHISDEIIEEAAKESKNYQNKINYEGLIPKLSEAEKTEWLIKVVKGELRVDVLLRNRLEKMKE
ncbi:MAG: hypothetical protein AAF573_15495 [Bacteroidota bacterium]